MIFILLLLFSSISAIQIKISEFSLSHYRSEKNVRNQIKLVNEKTVLGKIKILLDQNITKLEFDHCALRTDIGNNQAFQLLEQIFEKNIGGFKTKGLDRLVHIVLKKPLDQQFNFEQSELKNQCWKLDIYPPSNADVEIDINYQVMGTIRFCVPDPFENKQLRDYRYLLDIY